MTKQYKGKLPQTKEEWFQFILNHCWECQFCDYYDYYDINKCNDDCENNVKEFLERIFRKKIKKEIPLLKDSKINYSNEELIIESKMAEKRIKATIKHLKDKPNKKG